MDQPTEVGDWRQISTLGSGAFGTVTLWRNQKNSDFIAIKKCKFLRANALSAKQRERWHMEVDFLKSIHHRNIISFKRLDPELEGLISKYNPTKLPLLSMEYCKKGNLRRYLTSEPIKLCGLPEHDVRYILEDISSGLDYLHSKNITHRDIKPDNIVLQHCDSRKGETLYKIIDLGYAKELQDATLSFVGTLHYLAPEIFYNHDYSCSVDYWSLGTMAFEITCGVLPFLPESTPFERYEKIKDKGAEDICIYVSNSGAVTNSTEIKKEHFITSCFKQNIESWLKRVLQIDPARRRFNDDIGVFDYLRFILDKRIIKVFSVYKQEFYSYEINYSTLFGTLKDWVSRDIKIPKNDLLFLFRGHRDNVENDRVGFCNDDNALLQSLISTDDVIFYVYKKSAIVCETYSSTKLPNLVKDLFNPPLQMKFTTKVYRQVLFFLHSELRTVIEFKNAYLFLIRFIQHNCDIIRNMHTEAINGFNQICSKIDNFLQKKKNDVSNLNNNMDFKANPELNQCLQYFERFISNIERREANLKDFVIQFKMLNQNVSTIEDVRKNVRTLFDQFDIHDQFNQINGKAFLEKIKNSESHEAVLKSITKVVSETIKIKYKLLASEVRLKDYSKDFCFLLKWTEQLLSWVDDFIRNIQKLIVDFSVVEENYDKIVSEIVKTKKLEFVLNIDDTKELIKENEILRCQFANLLSQQIAAHKGFVEESMNYFEANN